MKHLTNAFLFQKLKSPHVMDRVFAAEELGERRERAAIMPLRALLDNERTSLEDFDALAPAISALAAIGEASAARSILGVLRASAGYVPRTESVPLAEIACRALVQLGARAAVPALKELQLSKLAGTYRTQLARAIAALGGAEELPFLQRLLASGVPQLQTAGVTALAMLHHLPSAPMVEPMCRSPHEELRWIAQGALVAMGAPGARNQLCAAARIIPDFPMKMTLLGLLTEHEMTWLADVPLELAGDPRWASDEDLLFESLDTALHLGCGMAAGPLLQLYEDRQQPRCKRIRAAAILTERGQAHLLVPCLEFLLASSDSRSRDPRDSPKRRNTTQREVIQAVTRYGRQHRASREAIVEALYELSWRGLDESDHLGDDASYIPDYASHAVYVLSGAITRSELDRWRLAQTGN